jgi:phenylpropionate dioxygenase-like ring-hydroxylating dioxygenase large terminal subunit
MATATQATKGQKWHDRYPELGTGPIPIEPYISREYFEKEQEKIFRKVWLNIGRVEQLPNPGDYFVKALAVCNTSILAVRGKDGIVRAFHNMCSHRGNQLVWNSKGSCQVFTCKFHGWAYALDGSLRHITDEDNFFGLNKDTLGMTPVSVDTWNGFIFINVDLNPTETLAEYLGDIGTGLISEYPFEEGSTTCFSWQTELQANWKVLKDAFQETYHFATLHRRTLWEVFASKANVYAHALDFTLFPSTDGCRFLATRTANPRRSSHGRKAPAGWRPSTTSPRPEV